MKRGAGRDRAPGAGDAGRPGGGVLARLRARWGVSTGGVVAILAAFSVSGSLVVRISGPILDAVLPPDPPRWLWWTARIGLIVPLYQVILVAVGTLLGQFRFFWEKERRVAAFLARPFRRRRG